MEITSVSGDSSTLSQGILSSLTSDSSNSTSTSELELDKIITKVKQSNSNYTVDQLMDKYDISRTDAQKILDKIEKEQETDSEDETTSQNTISDNSTVQFDV